MSLVEIEIILKHLMDQILNFLHVIGRFENSFNIIGQIWNLKHVIGRFEKKLKFLFKSTNHMLEIRKFDQPGA